MAALEDLIKEIPDASLRERIAREIKKLKHEKKFGLVFEEQMPEVTPLYDVPIKNNSLVAKKIGKLNELYTVKNIDGHFVDCIKVGDDPRGEVHRFERNELVAVAQFGDPIYPCLQKLDEVINAPNSDLWHILIEAENFHALQLLQYVCSDRKVDCIYIDPPYNTGARDWKYNNDYVDSADAYRHSKWLSMMQKRLRLAKKILNPADSVLIVTIDEHEYLHLGCLLEKIFPEAHIQMITSVINPSGKTGMGFSIVCEYIFFIFLGESVPCKLNQDMLLANADTSSGLSWETLIRSGVSWNPASRPNLFYPILIDTENERIVDVGAPTNSTQPLPKKINGYTAVFPIRRDGSYGIWRLEGKSLMRLVNQGYAFVSSFNSKKNTFAMKYLMQGDLDRISSGEISVERRGKHGEVEITSEYCKRKTPKNVWNVSSHNAGKSGSELVSKIIGRNKFPFPKSLYAVRDTLKAILADKPDALIVDFFAGSGTTMHAVNLLNAEDGGKRRCILVTNNEVSEAEEKRLRSEGYQLDDEQWQRLGIARYVTWQRTVCSIEGHDIKGEPLKGNYLGSDIAMSDGFKTNAAFFKLGFLDKNSVALGRQFKEILSVLWLKAGGHGRCPTVDVENKLPPMLILVENKFAVLLDEKYFMEFEQRVLELTALETIFIVTDSNDGYISMTENLRDRQTYQLYRDYLENFRINAR